MKFIPNLISILRILLVIPTVYFLANEQYSHALFIFFIAGLSDGLDGFLARHFGWVTRLGSFLDPMGDKLLMTAGYFMLGWLGQLPLWLVATVIGRDLVIVLGAIAYRLLVQDINMRPLLISKLNTIVQIALVLFMLFTLSDLPMAKESIWKMLTDVLIYIVMITTILSGLSYVIIWSKRAIRAVGDREKV